MLKAATELGFPLSEVSVRPVRDAVERLEWDRVMADGHYLGFRGMFGGGLRHVAVGPDGRWLALLGWCSGAFKTQARDGWIGWAPEQQYRRLHLVANNCRFLVRPEGRVRNLASRVLALSLRRLSGDMEVLFGHPVLLAETFVDPSRFKGSCYLGAGWTPVGHTRGFARSNGGWVEHGEPKAILVHPVARGAQALLSGLDEPEAWGCARGRTEPPAADRLRSLFDFLRGVPECRSARGVRHSLASVLAIAAAGEARRGAGSGRHFGVRATPEPAATGSRARLSQPHHGTAHAAVAGELPPYPVVARPGRAGCGGTRLHGGAPSPGRGLGHRRQVRAAQPSGWRERQPHVCGGGGARRRA